MRGERQGPPEYLRTCPVRFGSIRAPSHTKDKTYFTYFIKKNKLINLKKNTSVDPEGDVQFGRCIARGLGGFSYYGGIIASKLNNFIVGRNFS